MVDNAQILPRVVAKDDLMVKVRKEDKLSGKFSCADQFATQTEEFLFILLFPIDFDQSIKTQMYLFQEVIIEIEFIVSLGL